MKTIKLLLVLSMLSFGMYSISQPGPEVPCKKIPIAKAIDNPGLVKAMYHQIDRTLILIESNSIYVARVNYKRTNYLIYGKLEEWQNFFLMDPYIKKNKPIKKG